MIPLLVFLFAQAPSAATQLVVADVTYTHSAETTKDSHYRVPPPAAPANWRAPINYAAGTAHVHLEVLSKPSDAPTRFLVCFEATPSYACTAQSPPYTSTGTVDWSSPFPDFYQYARVDWTIRPRTVALILKDTKNVKPAPENVGAAESARYLPTKVRVVVTLVPPGGTYTAPPVAATLQPAKLAPWSPPPPPGDAPIEGLSFPGQWAPSVERFGPYPQACQPFPDVYERLACLEALTADWPRLARYAAANAALAPPRREENRVVFFGDSITDGWSRPNNGGFFPGKPYVNRGIGGQTALQMLGRFHDDVIALGPKVVVILAGTNDVAGNTGPATPEAIESNLVALCQLARAAGIRVVLASLLPVSDDKKDARGEPKVRTVQRPPAVLRQINTWMATYARREKHVFLDYHAALADSRGLLKAEVNDDGLHPNAAGYALMAPLAEKAIAEALRRR